MDIGFRISKKYWGNGIATETAKAVLQFAFIELNIKTVLARVIKENIASIKVIEKLGMKFRNSFTDKLGEWLVYEISAKQLK
ncbi:MAG: GNAT family N-acetyltransferase [Bacteroidetes bacterium]|nr:GNAT family N-acetyltransferase [Bacteroidota bacterium]